MKKMMTLLVGNKRDVFWGVVNALIVSSVVYWINYGEYGVLAATIKQAIYALFFGSHMVRVARFVSSWALSHYYIPNALAVWIGIGSAFLLNTSAITILHTVKGTPHPLHTIFAITTMSLVGLSIVGHIEVRRLRSTKHQIDL